jgi:hypothetical protein
MSTIHEPPDELAALVGALDPGAEIRYRFQFAREEYERGRADGWREGREDAHREVERDWREMARKVARGGPSHAELEAHRWHVCCRPCRLGGHRAGCTDCEDRTRETFGEPHPDDYQGVPVARDEPAGQRAAA